MRVPHTSDGTEADLDFHRTVVAATKNDLLGRVEMLTRSLFAERDRIVHRHIAAASALELHRALFEAIAAGDPTAARGASERLLGRANSDAGHASFVTVAEPAVDSGQGITKDAA